jgi:hypothetical protein
MNNFSKVWPNKNNNLLYAEMLKGTTVANLIHKKTLVNHDFFTFHNVYNLGPNLTKRKEACDDVWLPTNKGVFIQSFIYLVSF